MNHNNLWWILPKSFLMDMLQRMIGGWMGPNIARLPLRAQMVSGTRRKEVDLILRTSTYMTRQIQWIILFVDI